MAKTHLVSFARPGLSIRCNQWLDFWSVSHVEVLPTCKHCRRHERRARAIIRRVLKGVSHG